MTYGAGGSFTLAFKCDNVTISSKTIYYDNIWTTYSYSNLYLDNVGYTPNGYESGYYLYISDGYVVVKNDQGQALTYITDSGTYVSIPITKVDYSKTATVNLTTNIEESYEWNINTNIDFGKNVGVNKTVEKTNTISVNNYSITSGRVVNISLSTDNTFKVASKNDSNNKLNFVVKKGDTILKAGDNILKVSNNSNNSTTLKYDLSTKSNGSEIASEYNGTIKFVAEIVNQ